MRADRRHQVAYRPYAALGRFETKSQLIGRGHCSWSLQQRLSKSTERRAKPHGSLSLLVPDRHGSPRLSRRRFPYAISSGLLGCVQARVRRLYQFLASAAVIGTSGHSGTDGDRTWYSGKLPAIHHAPQFLGHAQSMLLAGLRKQHGELFSTVPADHVDLPELL